MTPSAASPSRAGSVRGRLASALSKLEKAVCCGAIAAAALLPLLEALGRLVFHRGIIPGSASLTSHLCLVAALFAVMLTTKERRHLSIGLVQYLRNARLLRSLACAASVLSAFVLAVLFWCSLSFIKIALDPPSLIAFIPDRVFALALPICFAVSAVRFALQASRGPFAAAPLLLGTLAAAPAICKLLWGFDMPEAAWAFVDFFSALAERVRTPVFVLLLLAALCGAPLFVILGGLSLLFIQASWGEIDVTANQIYTGLTQDSIVSIPLFTLTGFFLSESRAGERLMRLFRACFGALPGGMIFAVVLICAFFTSFTGASGVTILALGGILYSALRQAGYPDRFSIGLLAASGSIGLLFPPSLPIILVGSTTQTNILHLFAAGLLPGILLVAAMIAAGVLVSLRAKVPREPFRAFSALAALRGALPEVLLPVTLIAGYFSGILSIVEIGAAALVYAFIAEVFVTRDIALRDLPRVFSKAIPICGGILAILALSQAFSYYIVDTQAPQHFAAWMQGAITSRTLMLVILNLALLVVGCLMDIFSAIVIVLPLVMPLGAAYGIDPVHLGIIFLVNLEAGYLTPPVGLNLFLAAYRFEKPFVQICRLVLPFLIIQLLVVLLVTYAPALSLYLTRFF